MTTQILSLEIDDIEVELTIEEGKAVFRATGPLDPATVHDAAVDAEAMMLERAASVHSWLWAVDGRPEPQAFEQPARWPWLVIMGIGIGIVAGRLLV